MMRFRLVFISLAWLISPIAGAQQPPPEVAAYLLPGAPVFDLTIAQFRERFNSKYPKTSLREYHSLADNGTPKIINPAATKITETLYSSAALEPGTGKIKSLQLTWIPVPGAESQAARTLAMQYMANIIHFYSPQYSTAGSQQVLERLIKKGKGKAYFAEEEGAIRYVVADHGDAGLTLAAEPIRLTLAPTQSTPPYDEKQSDQ